MIWVRSILGDTRSNLTWFESGHTQGLTFEAAELGAESDGPKEFK